MDWGGWRVSAAEYDRDPDRIEAQARLMTQAPQLLDVVRNLIAQTEGDADLPAPLAELSARARDILRVVDTRPQPGKAVPQSKAA